MLELTRRAFASAMAEVRGTFAEREHQALGLANELVRSWLEDDVAAAARGFGEEIRVAGQRYRRHASGVGSYHTLCGKIRVARDTYRQVGLHNGPTVVPLELALGIHDNATPALVTSAVQAFAMMPLRGYEAEMAAAHRVVPARSTLERIVKRVGAALHEELPAIEAAGRRAEQLSPGARSISVGIDRTSVPMAEPTGDAPPRRRPHGRQRPAPVAVHYRMAYVGTVAVHGPDGGVLASVRCAASASEGPAEMLERLAAEVHHLLAQRRALPVIVVQDGAPELWRLVDEWAETFAIPITARLIDRYHVDERLAQASELIAHDRLARWRLQDTWRLSLARTDRAIERIAATMRRLVRDLYGDEASDADLDPCAEPISRATLHGPAALIIEGHLTYFRNHQGRFGYASARRRGFAIGSGVTEGACKSMIAARCKRSGQRWQDPGLSPCLLVRSLYLNGRLSRGIEVLSDLQRNALHAV